MKFNIHGDKIDITPAIRGYVEEKIGKLDKYFSNPEELTANALVRVRGIEQTIEVTIPTNNIILRGEASSKDLYAAIDLVSEKIESQVRKNKTRMKHRKQHGHLLDFNVEYEMPLSEENIGKIVKRKEIEMKPMSEEEAMLQMELLDHEFFVFKSEDDEKVCVMYKRVDGNYGLIITN
jgi:putative sigma-54 modulation protein